MSKTLKVAVKVLDTSSTSMKQIRISGIDCVMEWGEEGCVDIHIDHTPGEQIRRGFGQTPYQEWIVRGVCYSAEAKKLARLIISEIRKGKTIIHCADGSVETMG